MTALKINHQNNVSNDFYIFAINSSAQASLLAFQLNSNLEILLYKNEKDITVALKDFSFNYNNYIYEDEKQHLNWQLIKNTSSTSVSVQKNGIFSETNMVHYILPEMKNINYFLKITNIDNHKELVSIHNKLKNTPTISGVYLLDNQKIKSINNINF
jgi:hypothetical protein